MTVRYRPIRPGTKWFKKIISKIILVVLGRAFQSASRHDPDIKEEVASWREGFTLIMKILPQGPRMGLEKKDGRLIYRGARLRQADLEICFKNLESAFLVLTPQMSAHQAFVEKRMRVKGDLGLAMSFTRALVIVLALLYPGVLASRLVKRMPKVPLARLWLRARLYSFGILLGK